MGGAPNAFNSGETGFPLGNAMFYGFTGFARDVPLGEGKSSVRLNTDGNYTVYAGYGIAQEYSTATDVPFQQDRTVNLRQTADPYAVLPRLGEYASAVTRQDIIDALTPAAEGAGLGLALFHRALDVSATDPTKAIRWENLPSGAHWNDREQLDKNTLTVLPLRKVLNRRPDQPIAVAPGTEWRSYAADKVTLLQDWTAAPGMVEPDQFVQIRTTTSAESLTTVLGRVTINGVEQTVRLRTRQGEPTAFLTSAGGYFVDPAPPPANTTRIEFSGKFYFSSLASNFKLLTQESLGCDLEVVSNGSLRLRVEDGDGAPVLNNSVFAGAAVGAGKWHTFKLVVDFTAQEAVLTLDGKAYAQALSSTGSGFFQTGRQFAMLAVTSGNNRAPNGTRISDMELRFGDQVRKAISNVPAEANANGWKRGADFT